MATPLKLRSDIRKLKKALETKGISASIKAKLKSQLDKAEAELQATKKGKAPKTSSTGGTKTTLSKLQSLIKKKKYGVYRGQGVDLERDSDRPAKPIGKRKSKLGNTYYEYRANRIDVKQPPKRYPKLEEGGYMADGGINKKWSELSIEKKEKLFKDNNYSFPDILAKREWSKLPKKERELFKEYIKEMASGGYMADGGEINNQYDGKSAEQVWGMWSTKQRVHFLVDHYMTNLEKTSNKNEYIKAFESVNEASMSEWNKLPRGIQMEVERHIYMGQYASGGYMAKGGEVILEEDYYGKSARVPYGGEMFLVEWQGDRPTKDSVIISDYGFRVVSKEDPLFQQIHLTLLKAMKENNVRVVEKGGYMAKGGETHRYEKGGYMAKGGEVDEKYEVELFFKGLTGDNKKIGKYVVTQKTLDNLEDEWAHAISIDVIEESDKNPISWYELKKSLYSKGKEKGFFAKGGYMAKGGATEHGLKVGDHIMVVNGNVLGIKNEETGEFATLDISTGERRKSKI